MGYTNGKDAQAAAYPAPPPPLPPAPEPIAAPAELAPTELGQVLSPSQVNTFIECPAQWYFKYLVGLPEPATGSLAFGTAIHTAIGFNLRQKIRSRQDMAAADVVGVFHEDLQNQLSKAQLRDDEDAGELGELGRSLVEHYMCEAAPKIQPAQVEMPVAGAIGGVEVRGFIDLVDVDGVVVDLKTAAKRPNGISGDHRLQLTTYDLLCPLSRGKARLDTLVKTKTVQFIQQSTEIGPADVQYAETIYSQVQDAIKDGIFYPRRSSWRCSKRNCAHWRACEKEYGGEVEP